jgi:Rrf2 family protein
MRLSRKSDYALRAIRYLSSLPEGGRGSISVIAESEAIPREFLAKILKDLTQAKLLKAFKGVSGGYQLAKAPNKISFLNVVEAIDGPIRLSLSTEARSTCPCRRKSSRCEMCKFWQEQEKRFVKAMGSYTYGKFRKTKKRAKKAKRR